MSTEIAVGLIGGLVLGYLIGCMVQSSGMLKKMEKAADQLGCRQEWYAILREYKNH